MKCIAMFIITLALFAATSLADDNSATQTIGNASLAVTNVPATTDTQVVEKPAHTVTNIATVSGVTYTNAVIVRVEPDGLVLKLKSGVRKIYFTELSQDIQDAFGYDPEKVKAYRDNAAKANKQAQENAELQKKDTEKQKKNEEWQKEQARAAKWLEDRKKQDAEGEKRNKAAQARHKAEDEARNAAQAAETRRTMDKDKYEYRNGQLHRKQQGGEGTRFGGY